MLLTLFQFRVRLCPAPAWLQRCDFGFWVVCRLGHQPEIDSHAICDVARSGPCRVAATVDNQNVSCELGGRRGARPWDFAGEVKDDTDLRMANLQSGVLTMALTALETSSVVRG